MMKNENAVKFPDDCWLIAGYGVAGAVTANEVKEDLGLGLVPDVATVDAAR